MFLILPLILLSGLFSILTIVVFGSLYGLALIVMSLMIRNVRQETGRDGLRQFLRWVAVDHGLAAFAAFGCVVLLTSNQQLRDLVPMLKEARGESEAMLLTFGAGLGFLAVIWLWVCGLLLMIERDLAARISIHRQLRWHPWTLAMMWVGLFLNLSTCGVILIISAPLLWHLVHVSRLGRQSTLVWTLAIAVRQGLPLGPEVLAASEGLWGRERLRWQLLSENLDAGTSLASSLERQPGLMPLSAVMMIRMGEETNMLAATLESCAISYTRRTEREADMLNAQQAFLLLLIPLFAIPQILGFLCYYIVPKFKKIFEDFGTELPALTQGMISLMEPGSGASFLLFLFAMGGLTLVIALNVRDWERDWPLLNFLVPRINGPPILRGLALLIREQRSLTAGIQGLMWSHPRPTVRRRLNYVYQSLQHGGDLANSLALEKLIRKGDIALLRAAERVNNLPWCLEQLAESTESKFWYRFRIVLEVGFPVAVVALGLIVLLVVVGFFLPLVKLLNDLS